jgi:hypothetical protein
MTAEVRTPASATIERTRDLLYCRGGLREFLELILQQGGVQKGASLDFESNEDLDCVRICGVLRGETVRGISVVKIVRLPEGNITSAEYAALVPTQDVFELSVSEHPSKRRPYFAAGQLYFIPPTQIERDVAAMHSYQLYRTVFSDISKTVGGNIGFIKQA